MNTSPWRHFAGALRLQLWVAPALSAVVAALAAVALAELDSAGWDPLDLEIQPASARALLSAVATAMISFTALVFSVTMLVLQMASTQLSPRVMRTFLRDRTNQAVLSLFVATFVFALLALVGISEEQAPQLVVITAIALVLAAVLAFVVYIDHMAHTIRSSSVIQSIAAETRASIEQLFPEEEPAPVGQTPGSSGVLVRCDQNAGYVVLIDVEELADSADSADVVVEIMRRSGDFVAAGSQLARIHGDEPDDTVSVAVVSAVTLADERAMTQDALFGFRQLMDVALRALSPSTNDQTTANQVIDRLGDLLRLLADRPMPASRATAREGTVRVIVPAVTWHDLVAWVIGEVGAAARDLEHVASHLRDTMEAVAADASTERAEVIERVLDDVVAEGRS